MLGTWIRSRTHALSTCNVLMVAGATKGRHCSRPLPRTHAAWGQALRDAARTQPSSVCGLHASLQPHTRLPGCTPAHLPSGCPALRCAASLTPRRAAARPRSAAAAPQVQAPRAPVAHLTPGQPLALQPPHPCPACHEAACPGLACPCHRSSATCAGRPSCPPLARQTAWAPAPCQACQAGAGSRTRAWPCRGAAPSCRAAAPTPSCPACCCQARPQALPRARPLARVACGLACLAAPCCRGRASSCAGAASCRAGPSS
mmetsp:Transcript_34136/g.86357  ORF Transcript_34136/g.86357 Transcript_34136/m.86357 type:complete len:259 (+) Transcript_34136:863-1639(+)